MTTQLNLFPGITNLFDHRGDIATSTSVLWSVEEFVGGAWRPCELLTYSTRCSARAAAKSLRLSGAVARVIPYKRAHDSQYRPNRQVLSERLDY